MADPIRMSPQVVREKVVGGAVLLVCAYEDEEKFRQMHLEGAISYTDFTSRLPSFSMDQEIIFYCG